MDWMDDYKLYKGKKKDGLDGLDRYLWGNVEGIAFTCRHVAAVREEMKGLEERNVIVDWLFNLSFSVLSHLNFSLSTAPDTALISHLLISGTFLLGD